MTRESLSLNEFIANECFGSISNLMENVVFWTDSITSHANEKKNADYSMPKNN